MKFDLREFVRRWRMWNREKPADTEEEATIAPAQHIPVGTDEATSREMQLRRVNEDLLVQVGGMRRVKSDNNDEAD